jgi:cytochrome oxidase Cu insertion factor (SCO1/SenC/PrrC family)
MPKSDLLPQRRTLIFAISAATAAVALGAGSLLMGPPVCQPTGSGTALVGGPFTMVKHTGETVTDQSYKGKYTLLFFGFTYCPQICPAELQVMTAALDMLGPKANDITPIFVSIDPERDTPEQLASYLSNFHKSFVGLTGSPQQVADMAKAYRVFYSKVENKDDPAAYMMDHSTLIFLMDQQGAFRKHFTYATDPAELAKGITQAIDNKCD